MSISSQSLLKVGKQRESLYSTYTWYPGEQCRFFFKRRNL